MGDQQPPVTQQSPFQHGGGDPSMGPGAGMGGPGGGGGAATSIDLNALASYVQQFQKQQNQQQANNTPPGLQEAIAALMKGAPPPAQVPETIPPAIAKPPATKESTSSDPQSLMEQISHLTKSLDEEKSKSRAFQEEKKREMKGFLTGIKDYVTSLDGVKDPNAKNKFMQVVFKHMSYDDWIFVCEPFARIRPPAYPVPDPGHGEHGQ